MQKYSEKTREILKKADEIAKETVIRIDDTHKFVKRIDYNLTFFEKEGLINPYVRKLMCETMTYVVV